MSPRDAAVYWAQFAIGVGIVAVVAAVVGYLYGRLARGRPGERTARGLNVIAISAAAVAVIGVWLALPSSSAESAVVPDNAVLADLVTAVTGGLAAAIVAATAVAGIVRARPDLPGVDGGATLPREYARYFGGTFLVVLLLVPGIRLAVQTGPLGIGAFVVGIGIVLWVFAPLLQSLTTGTRPPTDAERDRLERLCDRADADPRTIRMHDGSDIRVAVYFRGAPGRCGLFVTPSALDALDDETLIAMLIARQEQVSSYEQLGRITTFAAAMVPLSAWVLGDLSATIGFAATGAVVLGGFAICRRLRCRADDRAAEAVGGSSLADAFERACEAAGFGREDLITDRRWLSMTPSIGTRIERLRERAAE
ncbi:peptidase [Halosolutus gelatinilyticus]|uniref:peptidase n=1 Tax=Halosolutus gelatinilyticus TaxID=2931975 RepID=UPI001FF10F6A|nr:peptidase [Halosolutus gelatinilyticus]